MNNKGVILLNIDVVFICDFVAKLQYFIQTSVNMNVFFNCRIHFVIFI